MGGRKGSSGVRRGRRKWELPRRVEAWAWIELRRSCGGKESAPPCEEWAKHNSRQRGNLNEEVISEGAPNDRRKKQRTSWQLSLWD